MTLYQITHNDDLDTGSGRTIRLNLYFKSFDAALTYVRSAYYASVYGVQGLKGNDNDIIEVDSESIQPKIYENIVDYNRSTGIDIYLSDKANKVKMLEKLSKEELIEIIKSKNNF